MSYERGHGLLYGVVGIAGLGALAVVGVRAGVIFSDGEGKPNIDLGPVEIGECAKQTEVIKNDPLSKTTNLESTIRSLGRTCHFCVTKPNFKEAQSGIVYTLCIDPDTITTTNESESRTYVDGIIMTNPADAPDGFIEGALSTNPDICRQMVSSLENVMNENFSRAYGTEIDQVLVPRIKFDHDTFVSCSDPVPAGGASENTTPQPVPQSTTTLAGQTEIA